MPIDIGKYLVALIIFVVIMVAGGLIMMDINTHYPTANVNANLTTAEQAHFDNLFQEYQNISDELQGRTLNESTSTIGAIENLVNGAYKAVRLVGLSFSAIPTTLHMLALKLQINAIFIYAITAAIFVLIAIALIYLFMRIIPGG